MKKETLEIKQFKMKVRQLYALPSGLRKCISCKKPFKTGSSPVSRSCINCHKSPKIAPKGYRTCIICKIRFVSNWRKGKQIRITCSNTCMNLYQKQQRNTLRGRLRLCLQKARKRRDCTITLEWLLEQWAAQNGLCFYTGWKMDLNGDKALKPTLERIDSRLDYTEDNVVICCRQANWAKNDYNFDQFLAMCQAIVKQHEKLNKLKRVA